MTATELALALGYKQADSVTRIFNRNSEEFTLCMSQVIENPRTVNLTVRIFSLRGAHLVAMFARTPVAKDFRKWVLDVIEKKESRPKKQINLSDYVSKEAHSRMQLKYHRMFRQYDDMIDRLRDQVDGMQRKCRRFDFKMHTSAISIGDAADRLGVSQSRLKKLLIEEKIIEERSPYVETNKMVLNLTKRGQKLEMVFIHSELIAGDVQDIIKITEDGMQHLQGLLNR